MNTYIKFCPNVFLAKCTEQYQKGDIITLTTKYGKENEHVVFNLVKKDDEYYYYSIIRKDGFDAQKYAENKAEKLTGYAISREQKSNDYFKASQEGREFLIMGEPIHVGHYSEKGHRALLERNQDRFEKGMQQEKKANEYRNKAKYWESKANEINLSMPESIEYFKHRYEKAKKYHQDMKNGIIQKTHSYSLTYAKKECNELKKKYNIAVKLWGEI